MPRSEKEAMVRALKDRLAGADAAIMTELGGTTVAEVTELRRRIKRLGGRYQVVKNSLAARAVRDGPFEALADKFGSALVGLAITEKDPQELAKALVEFSRQHESFRVRDAVVESRAVAPEDVVRLAQLPPRKVLLGMVVSRMVYPLSRLLGVLGGPVGALAVVLSRIASRKQGSEEG